MRLGVLDVGSNTVHLLVVAGTMNDALDVAAGPVIFSHSSARALTDHPRNVPDAVLERLAANGGVAMVTFVPAFVSRACR